MYDVITVGSATVDAFARTNDKCVKKLGNNLCYKCGAKILMNELYFTVGGGGTNSAACFSKLGHKTAFVGKVGRYSNSQRVIQILKQFNVDTSMISREHGRTGFSVILDVKGSDRSILTFKGGNNDLKTKDINWKKMNAKWFYCCSMLGYSFETMKRIVAHAKKQGGKVAFNPSSYMAARGRKYLMPVLKNSDLIILNKEEAAILTNKNKINDMLKKLVSFGPEIAVITNGKEGCYLYDGMTRYFIKAHKIKVAETTGAGDAFAATLVSGFIKNKGIEFSLRMALANAESVIRHFGAKEKLLSYNQVCKAIKNNPGEISKKTI